MKAAIALLALVVLVALATTAQARNIGPDAYGCTATDAVPYVWEDISSTGTLTLHGTDMGSTSGQPGFSFDFYGTTYSEVHWSINGLVMFGGGSTDWSNENLETSDGPGNRPAVAALWDDWDSDAYGSGVYYETRGTPGDRRFILQWHDLDHYSSSPSNVTFQAILFEGTNHILCQYQDVYAGNSLYDGGQSSTVGIRNANGHLTGECLQWSYKQDVIGAGQAIHYTPEPATLSLLALGAAVPLLRRRRRA